jgi:hypothetical protein
VTKATAATKPEAKKAVVSSYDDFMAEISGL